MIWRNLVGFLATLFAGFLLTACQTTENTPPPKMFNADSMQAMSINARRLEIIDSWQMPVQDPYVGHRATPLPGNVLADWATSVLKPAGSSGELVFDIRKAAVTMEPLPLKAGIDGLFTDQQSRQVRSEIGAKIMWLQPVGGARAMIDLRASHAITIPESATPGEVLNTIHESFQGALLRMDSKAREELSKIDRVILP